MSINLHISADSAKDFFQHLTELSAGFYVPAGAIGSAVLKDAAETTISVSGGGTGATPTTEEPAASPEPKAARKPRAAKTEAATSASEESSAVVEKESLSSGSAEEPASDATDASRTASNEDEGREGPYPDFDTEVTPVVLGAVKLRGKPFIESILSEFVSTDKDHEGEVPVKASHLGDDQLQEFIDITCDRLEQELREAHGDATFEKAISNRNFRTMSLEDYTKLGAALNKGV